MSAFTVNATTVATNNTNSIFDISKFPINLFNELRDSGSGCKSFRIFTMELKNLTKITNKTMGVEKAEGYLNLFRYYNETMEDRPWFDSGYYVPEVDLEEVMENFAEDILDLEMPSGEVFDELKDVLSRTMEGVEQIDVRTREERREDGDYDEEDDEEEDDDDIEYIMNEGWKEDDKDDDEC